MSAVEQETGIADFSTLRPLTEVARGYTAFRESDILFAKITPCMENGKVAIARGLRSTWGFGSTEFHVLRPPDDVNPDYLLHFLLQGVVRREAQRHMTGTAGQLRVPKEFLRQLQFPLPPLPEQRRIVARLEELFSRLDAGTAALEQARAQLALYRQAVLRDAFQGKLTAAWREAHRGELESASALLERIRREREAAAPARGRRQAREPEPLDTSELPELPEGWVWATVEDVAENHDRLRVPVTSSDRKPGPYAYYGASGVIDSVQDYLFDGDYLLLAEDGANLLARSTPISFQAHGKFWVNNHAHVLSLPAGMPLSYLEHYFNSLNIARYVTGTAQPKLTQKNMNSLPVPIAPPSEQMAIAYEVERRLSVADATERELVGDSERGLALRQAILRSAFSGKLVPQDPNDEPADALLARIEQARQADQPTRSTRGKPAQERLL